MGRAWILILILGIVSPMAFGQGTSKRKVIAIAFDGKKEPAKTEKSRLPAENSVSFYESNVIVVDGSWKLNRNPKDLLPRTDLEE